MLTPIKQIIEKATHSSEYPKVSLLSISETECRFENQLASLGHTVYTAGKPSQVGPNVKLIDNQDVFDSEPLDVILANNHQQLESYYMLAESLHIPLILVEHGIQNERAAIPPVFGHVNANETIKQMMGNNGEVIHYYAEPQEINWDEKKLDLLIYGNFGPQDSALLNTITKAVPNNRVINGNFADDNDRKTAFKDTKVFLNLSTIFALSYHILDAVSSHCVFIGNSMPLTHEYFDKDENAFFPHGPNDVVTVVKQILDKQLGVTKILESYDKLVNTTFSKANFEKSWNKLLTAGYTNTYIRGYNARA